MTGSWTLPAARSRGCFTRAIEESLALCRERDAALLLAFVTEDNASRRRLEAAGSVMFPTEYWVAEPDADGSVAPRTAPEEPDSDDLRVVPIDPDGNWRAHEARGAPGLRFTYPDAAAYAGQFLDRPAAVEVLAGPSGRAVVERGGGTDRVLALYPVNDRAPELARALLGRARSGGRTLFAFTTGGAAAEAWRAAGLVPRPGFLTALPAATDLPEAWSGAGVALENGDRM